MKNKLGTEVRLDATCPRRPLYHNFIGGWRVLCNIPKYSKTIGHYYGPWEENFNTEEQANQYIKLLAEVKVSA